MRAKTERRGRPKGSRNTSMEYKIVKKITSKFFLITRKIEDLEKLLNKLRRELDGKRKQ